MSDLAPNILEVRNLCKHFPVYSKGLIARHIDTVRAVDDVSFNLPRGRTLGLVGESGCGKTTCARTILRAMEPTSGEVRFYPDSGKTFELSSVGASQLKALRKEMQMIFQDPMASLNPRMTIEQIVGEPLLIHKMGSREKRREKVARILDRVGLDAEHMERYPHAFSGGQRQRVGIARALILNPSLVVCDEAVSALDVSVQAQVINLLQELQEEFNLTYIFVSHDLSVVRHISDEIAVMYFGRLVEFGPSESVFNNPGHPYTRSLLSAVPYPDPRRKMEPIRFNAEDHPDQQPVYHEPFKPFPAAEAELENA